MQRKVENRVIRVYGIFGDHRAGSVYSINGLAFDDAYRIFIALKKISCLIDNAQYKGEYHKQEAARLKEKYEKIIATFDNGIQKGIANGLEEEILNCLG